MKTKTTTIYEAEIIGPEGNESLGVTAYRARIANGMIYWRYGNGLFRRTAVDLVGKPGQNVGFSSAEAIESFRFGQTKKAIALEGQAAEQRRLANIPTEIAEEEEGK